MTELMRGAAAFILGFRLPFPTLAPMGRQRSKLPALRLPLGNPSVEAWFRPPELVRLSPFGRLGSRVADPRKSGNGAFLSPVA